MSPGDDAQERNVGRQHTDFATLLSLTATKQNVFLVGPAGSGKTSAVQAIAQSLGLPSSSTEQSTMSISYSGSQTLKVGWSTAL